MVFGARPFGSRTFGDTAPAGAGVVSAGAVTTHDIAGDLTVDGELAVAAGFIFAIAGELTVDGELAVGSTTLELLSGDLLVEGSLAVNIPPIEAPRRIVLVDADDTTVAALPAATVGDFRDPLTDPETWDFTHPLSHPQAHHLLDERIREAQLWQGDMLLAWGPMKTPRVDTASDLVHLSCSGARWHLTRRHVGKANRDNQLCNPSFEDGIGCWNFLKSAFFLDYQPLAPNSARVYAPGKDGTGYALELNGDEQPYETPAGAQAGDQVHTVVSGDTLWDLAATFYGSGTEWWRIYEANQSTIQSDAIDAGLWNPHDPGHWIFPGQNLTIPGVEAEQVVEAPEDDGLRWGGVFGWQEFEVDGGERGVTATLVGWCKVPSDYFVGWNSGRVGLGLGQMATDWRTNNSWSSAENTWGGARAFYTDVIEASSSRLDEQHPFDQWVRHEVSLFIPPGTTRSLFARMSGITGKIYWDDLALTYDTAFERFDTDQATIVAELVEHAQDPDFDKNDVNIVADVHPTGVTRDLVALHSEHGNIWRLISDYTELHRGLDVGMRYTPTQRILTTHYPRRGVHRSGLMLRFGRNVASLTWTFDGESAASSVILLGTGNGSDREEAAAIDTDAFADGLILERVQAVGPETDVSELPELAQELLTVASRPEVLTVHTYPHDPDVPARNLIGRLATGDTVPASLHMGRVVIGGQVQVPVQFEITGTYRVVERVLHPDNSFTLTLNPRERA